MNKIISTLLVTILLFLALFTSPAMAGFGVSPSNVYHEYLKPGGHFEQEITLSRSDAEEDLTITVEPALEELASWFTFKPGMKFDFPKGENRVVLTVIIDVPEDASYKSYEGVIRVKAVNKEQESGGVSIVKGARIDVDLVTTKISVSELAVKQMRIDDITGNDKLQLTVDATNNGNTDVSPNAKITVMNLQMQPLEELESIGFDTIRPNESKEMKAMFDTSMPTGEYFAEASVLVGETVIRKERLVFRILNKDSSEASSPINRISNLTKSFTNNLSKNIGWISILALVVSVGTLITLKITPVTVLALLRHTGPVVGLIITAIISGIILTITLLNNTPKDTSNTKTEEVLQNSGDVKGASTEYVSDPQIGTDRPETRNSDLGYPVFTKQDSNSEILFYAQEGDQFEVIEEKAGWYLIYTENGTGGWIEKKSIKNKSNQ